MFHVLFRILLLVFSGLNTSVGRKRERERERERTFVLLFTCNYVVSDRKSFLFLLVLRIGCVNVLWHSLSLPYNYIKSGRVLKGQDGFLILKGRAECSLFYPF